MSVFRAAISTTDESVDPGYLALFWALVGWSVSGAVILAMGIVGTIRATPAEVGPLLQNLGIALGAISTGFGVVVGAVGAFRAGDKDKHP